MAPASCLRTVLINSNSSSKLFLFLLANMLVFKPSQVFVEKIEYMDRERIYTPPEFFIYSWCEFKTWQTSAGVVWV